jgi:flagella basal body P-ring formation protein FlgA
MKLVLIASFFLMTSAQAQQSVALRHTGWPLNIEGVRAIVQQTPTLRGFDLSKAQIVAPADYTMQTPNPQLELRRIQQDREGRVLFVSVRCQERRVCGSFLVKVVLSNTISGVAVDQRPEIQQTSSALVRRATISVAPEPVLVQPRIPARLVIEEDGLRITESVLPLGRARLGEVVRVLDPISHRSLLAEVESPGILRPAAKAKQSRRIETR